MSCAIHTQNCLQSTGHGGSLNSTHRQTYMHATTTDKQLWSKRSQIILTPSHWNNTGPCWKECAGKRSRSLDFTQDFRTTLHTRVRLAQARPNYQILGGSICMGYSLHNLSLQVMHGWQAVYGIYINAQCHNVILCLPANVLIAVHVCTHYI